MVLETAEQSLAAGHPEYGWGTCQKCGLAKQHLNYVSGYVGWSLGKGFTAKEPEDEEMEEL